jgi:hypothetical protein
MGHWDLGSLGSGLGAWHGLLDRFILVKVLSVRHSDGDGAIRDVEHS